MNNQDSEAIKLGAIEKRIFNGGYSSPSFEFYVFKKQNSGHYQIYRFVPMLNGCGSWQITIGQSDWVDASEVVADFKSGSK